MAQGYLQVVDEELTDLGLFINSLQSALHNNRDPWHTVWEAQTPKQTTVLTTLLGILQQMYSQRPLETVQVPVETPLPVMPDVQFESDMLMPSCSDMSSIKQYVSVFYNALCHKAGNCRPPTSVPQPPKRQRTESPSATGRQIDTVYVQPNGTFVTPDPAVQTSYASSDSPSSMYPPEPPHHERRTSYASSDPPAATYPPEFPSDITKAQPVQTRGREQQVDEDVNYVTLEDFDNEPRTTSSAPLRPDQWGAINERYRV